MMWTTQQRSSFGALPAIIVDGATGGRAQLSKTNAPLVLMLHGVGLRAEAWAEQIKAISEAGYRVIAPDMLGHGASQLAKEDMPQSLEQFIEPIVNALQEPAVLIGHSMGAMIALEIAATYPEKTAGVAALNAIYHRSELAQKAVRKRADSLDINKMNDPTPTLKRWFGVENSTHYTACKTWLSQVNPLAYKAAYSVFAAQDGPTHKTLAQIQCPALFATGANEPNSTPEMSTAMADHTPKGRAYIMEGAAHMLPMTHSDVLSSLLIGFLKECHDAQSCPPS